MQLSFEVLHAIPGRVRIKVQETKDNPALAGSIVDKLLSRHGITAVRFNTACASLTINYDTALLHTFVPEMHLKGLRFSETGGQIAVYSGNGNGHKNDSKSERLRGLLHRMQTLVLPTVAFGLSFAGKFIPIAPLYGIVAAASVPIFTRATRTILREKRLGVDFLDATAIAIMGVQRNLSTCAFMAWLISIGEHIREETSRKSQKAIADLLHFHSDTVTVLRGRKRVKIDVECLIAGDEVVVNAGDVIPVDGLVVGGRAGIDQMSLTGESALLERSNGDRVYAGSVAVDGELIIMATAVGMNTRAGRIVQLLRSAPVHETRIEDYAARFADQLVLPTFALSGAIYALSRSLTRALSMLIVDFGTGVRVAAPTAFLSFMAFAAQKNIVIKGGRAMEKLAKVDTVVFDKTGTLTTGLPEVKNVIAIAGRYSEKGVLRLAAAAEVGLNHPVARALESKSGELGIRLPRKVEARLRVGLGVKALVEDKAVLVGSDKMMADEEIDIRAAGPFTQIWESTASSPLFVAVNGKLTGVITYSDAIRSESRKVITSLHRLGIKRVLMVTGDRDDVAQATAAELGIDEFISEVFPEKKLEIIRRLQKQGRTVAVVGDGINDSLALAHADVAITPSCAADAAKEAADVLLMEDDLRLLIEAFAIAKSAVRLVRQNFKIVAIPNAAAIALAAGGLLGPPGATFINNGSTVAAGLNGLRPLLGGRKRNGHKNQKTVCEVTEQG